MITTAMITVLARIVTLKGHEVAALEALRKMAEAVKENEPGCLLYLVTRSQLNSLEIYVYEIYVDEGAHQDHAKTPHYRELQSVLNNARDRSQFNLESLNQVAGFIRPEALK